MGILFLNFHLQWTASGSNGGRIGEIVHKAVAVELKKKSEKSKCYHKMEGTSAMESIEGTEVAM